MVSRSRGMIDRDPTVVYFVCDKCVCVCVIQFVSLSNKEENRIGTAWVQGSRLYY